MTTSPVPPGPANDGNDFEREQVVYIDGPGDTTVRPVSPVSLKIRERDQEQIAALLAWCRRQQEELNSRKRPELKSDKPNTT